MCEYPLEPSEELIWGKILIYITSWFTELNGAGRVYPTQSWALREVAEVAEMTMSCDFRINQLGQEVFDGRWVRQEMRMLSIHYSKTQVFPELEVRRLPHSYITTMGESNSQFHKWRNWFLFRLTLHNFSLCLKLIWIYGYNLESSCYELEFFYWLFSYYFSI